MTTKTYHRAPFQTAVILLAVLVLGVVEAAAQLPVRTRELHLISNNNTNYTLVHAVDAQTTNWSLTLPIDEGLTGSILTSTVAGTDAAMSWLNPGNEGEALTVTSGVPTWSDLSGLYWSVTGNTGTTAWNGVAGNYLGTNDATDLVFNTNNTEAIRINTSQQVGIGTAAPSQLLEVEDGNVLISTSAAGTAGELRMEEDGANGSEYFAMKSAASMANNTTYTLPDATGNAGEVLAIAAGPTATTATLEWVPVVPTPAVETFTANIDGYAVAQGATTIYLRMNSDGLADAREVTIADGTTVGQELVISCIAAAPNGINLQDANNLNLSGNFNLNTGDTITLIWDGAEWFETARRNN